jgi:uncharacterized membrane protein YesL
VADERLVPPDPPSIGRALREAASDFYFNSWRLVPANLVWSALLIVVILGTTIWLPAVLLSALLALPVAGMHRMAALLHRGDPAGFGDFVNGMRKFFGPALLVGSLGVLLAVVFSANVYLGLEIGGVLGWSFSAFALYGDIGLAMFLVAAWPILVDPFREDLPVRSRLRLAALVNLARPGRMFAVTLLIVALLLISTALFAALLTVSVAFVSLVATRYVLPAADRLEGRETKRVVG